MYLLYLQRRDDDRKSRSPSRSRSRSRSRDSRYSLLNKQRTTYPVYTLFTLAVVQPTNTFDLGALLSRCGIFWSWFQYRGVSLYLTTLIARRTFCLSHFSELNLRCTFQWRRSIRICTFTLSTQMLSGATSKAILFIYNLSCRTPPVRGHRTRSRSRSRDRRRSRSPLFSKRPPRGVGERTASVWHKVRHDKVNDTSYFSGQLIMTLVMLDGG